MASNYVSDTNAGKSISAYIILNKRGEHVATVRATWSNSGTCLVNVHDNKDGFQHAKRRGYGYDKFTSALSGMTIDGHEMSDHCGVSLSPPKGRKLFPRDYKPRKGYTLANWQEVSKESGRNLDVYDFDLEARGNLNFASDEELNNFESNALAIERRKLIAAWRESDDCERGYTSCFRKSGLDYLNAIGYRVIQAI